MRRRALATTRRRAAQDVDHDDLVGEPALGADAPAERERSGRRLDSDRVVGVRAAGGRRRREHAGCGLRASRSSTLAVRAPPARAQRDDRDAAAVERRQRGQPHARPRSRGRAAAPAAVELLEDGVLPGAPRASHAVTGSRRTTARTVPPGGAPTSVAAGSFRSGGRSRSAPAGVPDRVGAGQRVRRRPAAGRRAICATSRPGAALQRGRRQIGVPAVGDRVEARCRRRPAARRRCRSGCSGARSRRRRRRCTRRARRGRRSPGGRPCGARRHRACARARPGTRARP